MRKSKSHANRGMQLEKLIDRTNKQYIKNGVADVRKIPTPTQITKYNGRSITGFAKKGDLVDYVGIHQGNAVIFDAKQTKNRTSYPLSGIQEHQYTTLLSWWEKGANTFLVVYFSELGECYNLNMPLLVEYWEGAKQGGRKSIPYQDFADRCLPIESSFGYELNYLRVSE